MKKGQKNWPKSGAPHKCLAPNLLRGCCKYNQYLLNDKQKCQAFHLTLSEVPAGGESYTLRTERKNAKRV